MAKSKVDIEVAKMVALLDDDYSSVAEDGIVAGDYDKIYDTGSYSLNALISGSIYGGVPEGKVLALAGAEATGKTFFALSILQNFLDDDPNAIGVIFESESALTKGMLVERNIDVKRVMVVPVQTVQEFKFKALQLLNKYIETPEAKRLPMMFILDSLGQLSTTKEMEDSNSGSEKKDMTRAGVIKAAF